MKNVILQFLSLKSSGGMILIIAAVIAIMMANSLLRDLYQSFLDIPITFIISTLDISKPLLIWVNDGLIALFLVGLEVVNS